MLSVNLYVRCAYFTCSLFFQSRSNCCHSISLSLLSFKPIQLFDLSASLHCCKHCDCCGFASDSNFHPSDFYHLQSILSIQWHCFCVARKDLMFPNECTEYFRWPNESGFSLLFTLTQIDNNVGFAHSYSKTNY